MICILGAMYEEVKYFVSVLEKSSCINAINRNFILGKYRGQSIILGVTGCGSINAAITTQYVISNYPIDKIFFIGTAGGITNSSKGSVYKINKISCDLEDYPMITIDQTIEGYHLFTSSYTICSAKDKNYIKEKGCNLVDMEGYGVAYTCNMFGVMYEIIKVISDTADEEFNNDFYECIKTNIDKPSEMVICILNHS